MYAPLFFYLKYNNSKMIRLIATIDSLRGIVEEPNDKIKAFVDKKVGKSTRVYAHVGNSKDSQDMLEREVHDFPSFRNVWITGDSTAFEQFLDRATELYIIQINGMLRCDTEFPAFESKFALVGKSAIKKENGTEYQYQMWKNKSLLTARDAQES